MIYLHRQLHVGPDHFLSSIFNSRHVSACFTLVGAVFHSTAPEYLRERLVAYRSRQFVIRCTQNITVSEIMITILQHKKVSRYWWAITFEYLVYLFHN